MNFYEIVKEVMSKPEDPRYSVCCVINHHLLNSRGRVEGQRFNKKARDNNPELEPLIRANISSSVDLYEYITGDTPNCETPGCSKLTRFTGLLRGYNSKCAKCSRSTNVIPDENKVNFNIPSELGEMLSFIKDKKGNYSASRLRLLNEYTLNSVHKNTEFITWEAGLNERVYCLERNITSTADLPECEICLEPVTVFTFTNTGYRSIHPGECSTKNRKNILKDNQEAASINLRKHRSSTVYTRMNTAPINHEITTKFNKQEYLLTGTDYINLRCSVGHEYSIDNHYQGSFRCSICYPVRSKTQSDIAVMLQEYDNTIEQNNRKLITPKEIDIVSTQHMFGVEYDSLMFHSSGYSTYTPLNRELPKRYHLDKTENAEKAGVHLFHIFSSEYLGDKKEIWDSMLLSKMGISRRIPARKCSVVQLSTKEAREFCERNHLQGYVGSSIKMGLEYEGELIQVITLGTPRQGKYKGVKSYELMRMCSALGVTVQGGASKLIRNFERKYSPELLLSYANRRWASSNNVYECIGFKLQGKTPPNYFYFKGSEGDSAELMSRVKFQKHKLIGLKSYDPDLTEKEIMLKEGYRIIYDSGNYIYTKTYEGK